MPVTEQLNITIPLALAERLHAKVAAGEYANESELVTAALVHELDDTLVDDPETRKWLQTVGVERYDAYDADPENVFTVDDVRRATSARREETQKPA